MRLAPLFDAVEAPPLKARELEFTLCDKPIAVTLCRRWHSRLPNTQAGPWQFAFAAHVRGTIFAVALWNNPSTRCLPSHWLELRRMACAPGIPKNSCSRFLGWMVRYFKREHPERERCISYQDPAVHLGTIYRASGWTEVFRGVDRHRDRSDARKGTTRAYRSNLNGDEVDYVGKVRWEKSL